MLKEIFEQPETVENALRGPCGHERCDRQVRRLESDACGMRSIKRIVIAASGTSWHAALVGEYLIEELAQIRWRSSLRMNSVIATRRSNATPCCWSFRNPAKPPTHSPRYAKPGSAVIARWPSSMSSASTIARESDGGIYMHAGPEIGVASTKAFVSTLTILALLAVHLGRMRQLSAHRALEILRALEAAPKQLEAILAQSDAFRKIALKYAKADDFFFLGRGYTFPIALEGALKLRKFPTSTPRVIRRRK